MSKLGALERIRRALRIHKENYSYCAGIRGGVKTAAEVLEEMDKKLACTAQENIGGFSMKPEIVDCGECTHCLIRMDRNEQATRLRSVVGK